MKPAGLMLAESREQDTQLHLDCTDSVKLFDLTTTLSTEQQNCTKLEEKNNKVKLEYLSGGSRSTGALCVNWFVVI